jgi:NhaP-type Na+/H+ or K+/H+ antiporter
MILITVFVSSLFLYSLVSRLVDQRTIITAPIIFTVVGGLAAMWLTSGEGGSLEIFLAIAELGLVLLLFVDASRVDLNLLKSAGTIPTRLLTVGMLLTIGLSMMAALILLGDLSIWEAGILAAILAPTDAGLGQAIVTNPIVPRRIRESLSVEAGLNDGLAVPFLLFFIAQAGAGHGDGLFHLFVEQFGYGVVAGLLIGLSGGWLIKVARNRDAISHTFQQLGFVALPILCMLACEAIGGSMFIAAFAAGIAMQFSSSENSAGLSMEFIEDWGQLINLTVFFLFGTICITSWQQLELIHFIYAGLCLTVLRMIPVYIALIGTGESTTTRLFIGWFGPRGLASIVLGLVYIEHSAEHTVSPTITLTVIATVVLSIFAHGLSAKAGAKWYGRISVDHSP